MKFTPCPTGETLNGSLLTTAVDVAVRRDTIGGDRPAGLWPVAGALSVDDKIRQLRKDSGRHRPASGTDH